MLKRYVHGPLQGVDDPIAEYTGAGVAPADRTNLYTDARGSIVLRAGATGATPAINSYDEYGQPATTNVGRFQYTGQAWLPELGMYYYKARIYSPRLGRFMQTDPIGYEDQYNLYAYVGNDPINGVDPTGLRCEGPIITQDDDGNITNIEGNDYCDPENPEDDSPPIDVNASDGGDENGEKDDESPRFLIRGLFDSFSRPAGDREDFPPRLPSRLPDGEKLCFTINNDVICQNDERQVRIPRRCLACHDPWVPPLTDPDRLDERHKRDRFFFEYLYPNSRGRAANRSRAVAPR